MLFKLRILFNTFDNSSKNIVLIIILLSFLVGIIEMAGIGLIIPLLKILVDPNFLSYLHNLTSFLSNVSLELFRNVLFVLIFLIFLLKNILLAILIKFIYFYTSRLRQYLSCKLFENYLYSDFEHIANINSAEIIRNLTTSINLISSNFLTPLMIFINEIFIIFY